MIKRLKERISLKTAISVAVLTGAAVPAVLLLFSSTLKTVSI